MSDWEAPAPRVLTYVIGDIHGCVDPLERLLDRIDTDIAAQGGQAQVVFVGDYIDRGTGNADVLRFVSQATRDHPDRLVALMGNHEEMLLDFLAAPTGKARRWLRFGGLQTLASFGVGGGLTTDTKSAGQLLDAAGDLRDAMGKDLVDWIAARPSAWQSGSLWVVHAAADPAAPMNVQETKVLRWGHENFLSQERQDGQWVAFGHQPFKDPFVAAGKIAVDTGAVYGGPLTAARIDPEGEVIFLTD